MHSIFWASCPGVLFCAWLQKHHAAREVFLTQMVDNNDVESLWKPVQVCLPHQFAQAEGDDVYLCEYEYDTQFQASAAVLNKCFSVLPSMAP